MTKGPKEPRSSLQVWREATAKDIVTELEKLAVHFPRTDMDSRKWQVMFQAFYEDLKGLSIEALRDGCRRYRNNPESRFFPTPGQLREACRNPYDSPPGRVYDPVPELPPISQCITAERAHEVARKYGMAEPSEAENLVAHKEEVLARPPIQPVPIPMTPERKDDLLNRVKKALAFKFGPRTAQQMIAELPPSSIDVSRETGAPA